jgi:hypothetical protein
MKVARIYDWMRDALDWMRDALPKDTFRPLRTAKDNFIAAA